MNTHKYFKMMYDTILLFRTSRLNLFQKIKSKVTEASSSAARMSTKPSGTAGSGVGKGGGGGGTVREAGGGMGKFAAANEEGYFYEEQKRQLKKLKGTKEDSSDSKDSHSND